MPSHIRKGDVVFVRSGADKGKTGEVVSVDPQSSTCVVKGINLRTKHLRASQANPQGGVVSREAPVHMSKVSPIVDGKPVRVGFKVKADGSKVRVARKGGKELAELSVVHGPRA